MNANEISPKENPRLRRIQKVSMALQTFFFFASVLAGIGGASEIIMCWRLTKLTLWAYSYTFISVLQIWLGLVASGSPIGFSSFMPAANCLVRVSSIVCEELAA
jgi:hypothetical protein